MKSLLSSFIFALSLSILTAPMLSAHAFESKREQAKSGANVVVNVNAASADQIAKALDGIGLSRAKAIVAYRKSHGPFKSLSALTVVKGIGNKTIALNKSRMKLN